MNKGDLIEIAAKEADIRMLQKDLDAKPYVKSTEYISKDEAAAKMKEELGEDFISFLGDNPLPPSIDVYLLSDYTHPDSVAKIEKYILLYPYVKEVFYQESLLFLINENVNKISLFLLVLSTFLFLIALTIINNTIRLSIYSKKRMKNGKQNPNHTQQSSKSVRPLPSGNPVGRIRVVARTTAHNAPLVVSPIFPAGSPGFARSTVCR